MGGKPTGSSRSGWQTLLLQAWQRRGWLACALWPFSLLYSAVLRVRRTLYRLGLKKTGQLPVPVIVVGNVVVGGAGKTPTVVGLVQHLRDRGWTPGVVSRGHGREDGNACLEVTPDSPGTLVGDEPALIARATRAPMVVGRRRVEAAQTLLRLHPEVDIIVSDDGMQHWALARDLTVVVFDDRGCGNGWLLPAGLLREPWPAQPWGKGQLLALRTTRRAELPLASTAVPGFVATRRLSQRAVAPNGQCCGLEQLSHLPSQRPLAALAGIAQPDVFFDMLRACGLPLTRTAALPDHADAATLLAALTPEHTWLCTEKDAVKLFPLLQGQTSPTVWSVALEQTPEPAFYTAVDQALNGLSSAHGRQTP